MIENELEMFNIEHNKIYKFKIEIWKRWHDWRDNKRRKKEEKRKKKLDDDIEEYEKAEEDLKKWCKK